MELVAIGTVDLDGLNPWLDEDGNGLVDRFIVFALDVHIGLA